jgi:hypothetical protein
LSTLRCNIFKIESPVAQKRLHHQEISAL